MPEINADNNSINPSKTAIPAPADNSGDGYDLTHIYHSRGQRRKSGSYQQSHRSMHLNLVAMIDVVFLLLMYFLLSANLTTGEEVYKLDLPASLNAAAQPDPFDIPEQPVLIEIFTTGTGFSDYQIEIDMQIDQPTDFNSLYQFMDNARVQPGNSGGLLFPDTPILIRPAVTTRWEHAINAFNACLRAGYNNVSMIDPGRE